MSSSNKDLSIREHIGATSDDSTVNNVMRHQYRVLSDDEKLLMMKSKDLALAAHNEINNIKVYVQVNKFPALDEFTAFIKQMELPDAADSIHNAVNRAEEALNSLNKLKAALDAALISVTEAQFWATHAITK